MNCHGCNLQLDTLVRCLSPVEQRDEVRVLAEDDEDGIRGEFTGGMEIRQSDGTQSWLECPKCGAEIEGGDADRLEIVATEPPPCETIPLGTTARARGRNGWFRAAEVGVRRSPDRGTITLTVRSSRAYGDLPPILLELEAEDAGALLSRLERQVVALRAAMVGEG